MGSELNTTDYLRLSHVHYYQQFFICMNYISRNCSGVLCWREEHDFTLVVATSIGIKIGTCSGRVAGQSKSNLSNTILSYKKTCPGVKHVSSGHVACHLSDSSAGLRLERWKAWMVRVETVRLLRSAKRLTTELHVWVQLGENGR